MKLTARYYPRGKFDYRMALEDMVDGAIYDALQAKQKLTRRMIAEQSGMSGAGLSNVLSKNRHLSVEQLEKLLDVMGHRLSYEVDPLKAHQTRPLDEE